MTSQAPVCPFAEVENYAANRGIFAAKPGQTGQEVTGIPGRSIPVAPFRFHHVQAVAVRSGYGRDPHTARYTGALIIPRPQVSDVTMALIHGLAIRMRVLHTDPAGNSPQMEDPSDLGLRAHKNRGQVRDAPAGRKWLQALGGNPPALIRDRPYV